MAKFWPLHHYTVNVWERIGETLRTTLIAYLKLVGERVCQPHIFNKK